MTSDPTRDLLGTLPGEAAQQPTYLGPRALLPVAGASGSFGGRCPV
ncbi:hypothetical protein [Kitasatospora sp. NPDC057015]